MKKKLISVLLIVIGCVMTVFGAFSGQSRDVLNKAIVICLECVGFGQ